MLSPELVRQFAEAVDCAYEKLASNVKTLTQYMGSVTATSSLIPSGTCGSTGPDPCAPIERELEEAMGEVLARYQELLMDTNQLYCRAYDKPTLGRKKGYWLGHLKAFAEAQASLRRVIAKALAHGCPVPPRAWELSSPLLTPPPVCPAGRIPRP